jgi:arylsulfatase A-like enzyme
MMPVAMLAGFALALGSGPTPQAEAGGALAPARDRPPNILLIVTDDQRAEGTLDVMPKTRYWFEQGGTRFSNGFATTTLCCPGRGSIFTGRYAHNHGIRTNGGWDVVQLLDQSSTLQRYLQQAGYRTGLFGKYFYSWNLSVPPPYIDDWALFRGGYQNAFFSVNGTGQRVPYSTDFISERAVRFLQDSEAQDRRPWFLYAGTQAPHLVAQPEAGYAQAPVPPWAGDPAVFETDRTDKPPWVGAYNPAYGDTFADNLGIRQQQLRTLMSVDDLIGTTFDTLTALGEEKDTLAIFLSDNGYMWGDHSLGSEKRFPYTPSVQIPLLMRWPGHVAPGATDPRLVANVDVVPTALGAAGLSADPAFPLDGRSLLAPQARERLLLEYWRSPDGGPPGWASIRTTTYQYIEWYSDQGGALAFQEYYDLIADPWQLQNLLADADPANDPDVAALSAQLAADRGCVGRACGPAGAVSADALDGDDVRGQLDLARLSYQRLDAGRPLKVRVETQRGWRPAILRRGGSSRLVVQMDLDGDSKPDYRVRIVLRNDRLRAWIIGPSGRVGSLRVARPSARTVSFSVPGRSRANPHPGGGISLSVRSVFFHRDSKCDPACVDLLPDRGLAPPV